MHSCQVLIYESGKTRIKPPSFTSSSNTHIPIDQPEGGEVLEDELFGNNLRFLDGKLTEGSYVITPVTLHIKYFTVC